MAQSQVRVPGGGNTYLVAGSGNTKIEFLAEFSDTPGRPVGNVTQIIPIGNGYPQDIVTPYVQGMGTLTLTVWSQWGRDGWVSALEHTDVFSGYTSQLGGGTGVPVDLREVFEAQRQSSSGELNIVKVELGGDGNPVRAKKYIGCVISDISANEQIRQDVMEQKVTVTINYRHVEVVSADTYGSSARLRID